MMVSSPHLALDPSVPGATPADDPDAAALSVTARAVAHQTPSLPGLVERTLGKKESDDMDSEVLAGGGPAGESAGDTNAVSVVPGVPGDADMLLGGAPHQPMTLHQLEMHAPPARGAMLVPAAPKRKRKQYSSEEERRTARILKNRRTAEESRQRRLKRMKELEDIAEGAAVRENKLMKEIATLEQAVTMHKQSVAMHEQTVASLRAIVAERDATIEQLSKR